MKQRTHIPFRLTAISALVLAASGVAAQTEEASEAAGPYAPLLLETLKRLAAIDRGVALEVARCQELVAGYGDTHARGLASYRAIAAVALRIAGDEGGAETIAHLRAQALAEEDGSALHRAIAELEAERTQEAA